MYMHTQYYTVTISLLSWSFYNNKDPWIYFQYKITLS